MDRASGILVGSWNVGSRSVCAGDADQIRLRATMAEWLQDARREPQCWLVAVGLQELAPYPSASQTFCDDRLKWWRDQILAAVGADAFRVACTCRQGGLALVVLAAHSAIRHIVGLHGAALATGVGGLSNKGLLAVQLLIDRQLLQARGTTDEPQVVHLRIVTCHLTAFVHKTARRNAELAAGFRRLAFPLFTVSRDVRSDNGPLLASSAATRSRALVRAVTATPAVPLADEWFADEPVELFCDDSAYELGVVQGRAPLMVTDYLFICGDLNYRLELAPPGQAALNLARLRATLTDAELAEWPEGPLPRELAAYDQLSLQTALGNLPPLLEGQFWRFPPTYKYHASVADGAVASRSPERVGIPPDSGSSAGAASSELNWSRVPGWCDRVLFFFQHGRHVHDAVTQFYREQPAALAYEAFGADMLASDDAGPLCELPVVLVDYWSVPSARWSDHKPVAARFVLRPPAVRVTAALQASDLSTTPWSRYEGHSVVGVFRRRFYRGISELLWSLWAAAVRLWVFIASLWHSLWASRRGQVRLSDADSDG